MGCEVGRDGAVHLVEEVIGVQGGQPQQGNDPQPQANDPALIDIPDEDVPLADVPKTGDPMMFYLGISALSGLGLLKLSRK